MLRPYGGHSLLFKHPLKQQLDGIQQVIQAMEVINQGAKELLRV
jgi:hypothetical protein